MLVYALKIFYYSTLLQILQVKFHSENYLQPTVNVYNKFSGIWVDLYCNEGSNICSDVHVYISPISSAASMPVL